MGHGPSSFKKADVTRAVSAVRKAGIEVARIEVDTKAGKVVIIAGKPAGESNESVGSTADDELERWRKKKNAN
jgi:hypothetical protein